MYAKQAHHKSIQMSLFYFSVTLFWEDQTYCSNVIFILLLCTLSIQFNIFFTLLNSRIFEDISPADILFPNRFTGLSRRLVKEVEVWFSQRDKVSFQVQLIWQVFSQSHQTKRSFDSSYKLQDIILSIMIALNILYGTNNQEQNSSHRSCFYLSTYYYIKC